MRRKSSIAFCAAALLLAGCGGGGGPGGGPPPIIPTPPPVTGNVVRISADPFMNGTSQHATEVEPAAFAFGTTIVAAFQAGRFFNAGASDIAFATSHDGGLTWIPGSLPDMTSNSLPAGVFDSVSDPSVGYDAKHAVWLIASLPIFFSATTVPGLLVSRSSDGLVWGTPVAVAPGQTSNDKGWIACDNSLGSPHYGNCYVEWDDPSAADLIHMSTSSDGGLTWGPAANTLGNATGIGGQPLVQPNGTVIVPIDDANELTALAFVSHDGGASWSAPVVVSSIADHGDAANIRSGPLPSAAMDTSGKVYLAWQDCSFRVGCSANDIVMSTSLDGVSWTAPARIPIDAVASGVDHFIPGLGVDPTTSGAGAHLALTYYYYANTNCAAPTCLLYVGFVKSQDGGATWSAPVPLAGPMNVAWLPSTSNGQMVGDYIPTVFSSGKPYGIFAVAQGPGAPVFNEAMYAPKPGILELSIGPLLSSRGDRRIPGARSDHPPRPLPPRR